LCSSSSETAEHLCLHCPFAQQVRELTRACSANMDLVPLPEHTIEERWPASLRHLPKNQRRITAALLMYVAWNLWKERNRRVFEGAAHDPLHVLYLIKEEIALRRQACGGPVVS
ncbi:hypothetical protein BAE44_0023001, partial [Dichanthelium oligosanthes]